MSFLPLAFLVASAAQAEMISCDVRASQLCDGRPQCKTVTDNSHWIFDLDAKNFDMMRSDKPKRASPNRKILIEEFELLNRNDPRRFGKYFLILEDHHMVSLEPKYDERHQIISGEYTGSVQTVIEAGLISTAWLDCKVSALAK